MRIVQAITCTGAFPLPGPPSPSSAQVHGQTPSTALRMQRERTPDGGPLESLMSPLTVASTPSPFLCFKTVLPFVHSGK